MLFVNYLEDTGTSYKERNSLCFPIYAGCIIIARHIWTMEKMICLNISRITK
jgi:hypothetical protein